MHLQHYSNLFIERYKKTLFWRQIIIHIVRIIKYQAAVRIPTYPDIPEIRRSSRGRLSDDGGYQAVRFSA
ncbi:hypothetical protein [Desulfitobacterium sp.]|uniref:hypothetical protein n=1 Tax=Desulfitobacterium sp. TaxID=49981 RepID=UPI002BCDFEC0|nr:hypothetical protein [Desulfitobacterium sp.]HVJ48360.1 hypothetical protein [Desulfitobacterium sp.]